MYYATLILLIIIAYLLGSIPTSVWIGRKYFNIDVRLYGSKNAGATNTMRVLGPKAAIPVFIIDTLKGFAAVMLVHFSGIDNHTNSWVTFQIILGAAAVIGHILPIFAHFNGGKGVATLLGLTLALNPIATFTAFLIFVVVVYLWRYISLGSIIAGSTYPFLVIFCYHTPHISMQIFSIVAAIALVGTHSKNIKRLIKGEESKFSFKKSIKTA